MESNILYTAADVDSLQFKNCLKEKPVNILFHGIFGMAENVRPIAKMLTSKYFTIAYDLPNHGRSPSLENSNFINMAHMVHNSLQTHVYPFNNNQKIHVCGHSLGGKLAGVYALLYPQHVMSLIMLDIAPVKYPQIYLNEVKGLEIAAQIIKDSHVSGVSVDRAYIKRAMAECVKDEITLGFLLKNLYTKNDMLDLYVHIKNVAKDYSVLCDFPAEYFNTQNAKYDGPVLCIKAENSDYILPEYYGAMKHFFPHYKLETVAGAGHMVHAEKPQEVSKILERY